MMQEAALGTFHTIKSTHNENNTLQIILWHMLHLCRRLLFLFAFLVP